MERARVLSSFVVTLAVLAVIVGLSLRREEPARAAAAAQETTTLVKYHAVATIANEESITVHVVNVGQDLSAPAENFTIIFADNKGNPLSERSCDITAGQTCSEHFTCTVGSGKQGKGACVVRAIVVGESMGCVAPGMGTGQWMTNMEVFGSNGQTKFIQGADGAILQLPVLTCEPGVDNPGVDGFPPDIVGSPDSGFLPDSTLPPSPDTTLPPPDSGGH
jgi:hypothetical protein